ncbi:DUF3291 domain-containing protein [Maribacter sp. 2304DJ31-5]|uniref:DUF3291 domain-containing protein n=1 Tax=Maribacter sp. 2304DJ31-5 TaxID=3386273 RepID=UPI0039BCA900
MKATITSIELKTPFKFFRLSSSAWKITKQLKSMGYIDYKKKGFWTKHYTMTLWRSEDEMKKFALSGPHKEAIRNSRLIAKEIRTITVDADKLPSWSIAKQLLFRGKVIYFK